MVLFSHLFSATCLHWVAADPEKLQILPQIANFPVLIFQSLILVKIKYNHENLTKKETIMGNKNLYVSKGYGARKLLIAFLHKIGNLRVLTVW